MRPTLVPGLKHRVVYRIPDDKTVPYLFADVGAMLGMPSVLATAFMVGIFEWACTDLMAPHLDDGEGSVGTHVDFSHTAPTPAGLTVTVDAECIEVTGARARFRVAGHDGLDAIGGGLHERHVIKRAMFDARVDLKRRRAPDFPASKSPA